MATAQRIVPTEPAAPPRARSYRSARISRLLAIPASARKWATRAGAQQDSRIDLRAAKRGTDESVPLRAINAATLERSHCELRSQQRKLENEHGNDRGGDGKKRLREPCDERDFVSHVHAPLVELIEQ
jgi:hypothetical protein